LPFGLIIIFIITRPSFPFLYSARSSPLPPKKFKIKIKPRQSKTGQGFDPSSFQRPFSTLKERERETERERENNLPEDGMLINTTLINQKNELVAFICGE
jgi:hypothetical protein